jgi:hypothetical protein
MESVIDQLVVDLLSLSETVRQKRVQKSLQLLEKMRSNMDWLHTAIQQKETHSEEEDEIDCLARHGITLGDFIAEGTYGSVFWACYYDECKGYVIKRGIISEKEHQIGKLMGQHRIGPEVLTYFGCPGKKEQYMVSERMKDRLLDRMYTTGVGEEVADRFIDKMQLAFRRYGLVHHDIKPDNIMFNHSDGVRIIDYGLAFCAAIEGEQSYVPVVHGWIGLGPASYAETITPAWDILCLLAYMEITLADLAQKNREDAAFFTIYRQFKQKNQRFYLRLRQRLIRDYQLSELNEGMGAWDLLRQLIQDGQVNVGFPRSWHEDYTLVSQSDVSFFD